MLHKTQWFAKMGMLFDIRSIKDSVEFSTLQDLWFAPLSTLSDQ